MIEELQALLRERLRQLRMSARNASLQATGKPDAIKDIFRGRMPSADRLRQIFEVLEISYHLGVPERFARGSVPLLGIVRAGTEVQYFGEDYPAGESVRFPFGSDYQRLGAVRVEGESMYPAYQSGDTLFFDTQRFFSAEEIYGRDCIVECTRDGGMLKRVRRGDLVGSYNLESINPYYPVLTNRKLRSARPVLFVKKADF